MKSREAYCLVLSGGGAKGIYHIGAWRALRKIGIRVNAFIGNSIGAVIAGFLAQGKYRELYDIAEKIGIDFILNMPEEIVENGELVLNKATFSTFRKFYKNTIENRGLDTSPLRKLVYGHLDDAKIRKKGNDLGVVTYSISDLKPRQVFIEEMEEGRIPDYLLASSAFPGFQSPEIAGKKYIDGGVYDNIPYTMARKRGYRNLIVIDISGIGVKRKLNVEGGTTIYIKNSIDMGGVMDFSRDFLDRFYMLGYLDTMKTFTRLKGYNYFFVPDAGMENRFNEFIEGPVGRRAVSECVSECVDGKTATDPEKLKKIIPEHCRFTRDLLPVFIDCASTNLNLERIRELSYRECIAEIEEAYSIITSSVQAFADSSPKKIEAIIRKELKDRKFIKSPYYYFLLIDTYISGRMRRLLKRSLCDYFPELSAGHLFITMLNDFKRII